MSTPKKVVWPIEPHTVAKHEILRRYLQRWFPILNTHHGRIIYIDGFCGPGRYEKGEPGSPLIALDVALRHRKALSGEIIFLFSDENQDRINHLKGEIEKLPLPEHFKWRAETRRFHEMLTEVLDTVEKAGGSLAPTFAFIDPFGFSWMPFALVKRLLQKKRCEALITFMVESINRWLVHPDEQITHHITEAFGTKDCLQIADLPGDRISSLRDLYQRQLRAIAKFVRYFEMRDSENRVIYYLFFASNHPLGHVKMKEAMFDVGDGLYTFSDATDPTQPFLFTSDPAAALWPLMKSRFRGQEVLTDAILTFVENETAFLGSHMKATLKAKLNPALEPSERIDVRPTKADGKPWRHGTFPNGVQVKFPP